MSFLLQFIVHIQRHHHFNVHINKLGRKVKVTFEVRRINDIDNYIGTVIGNKFADIYFFWCISCKGIGSGQVCNVNRKPFVSEGCFFCINSYT